MEIKNLIVIIIIGVFLYVQINENIWPYVAPRSQCQPGYVPAEDNPKLCVTEIPEEPSYFPVLKEAIFMGLVFVALTYIFVRKKSNS